MVPPQFPRKGIRSGGRWVFVGGGSSVHILSGYKVYTWG
jgi:hypothetical protein